MNRTVLASWSRRLTPYGADVVRALERNGFQKTRHNFHVDAHDALRIKIACNLKFGDFADTDSVEAHFGIEEGISQIFQIRQTVDAEVVRSEPIRLLEVNVNTIPSGIMPIGFAPALTIGVPFPSVILEVTPEEFTRITANQLPLPAGWAIGEEIQRPATTVPIACNS